MNGYTKLFSSIVASTVWREPHAVRIVWITMLALADRAGVVEASLPGLADLSRVSVPECQEALLKLESPDEFSRTPDYEGRRIEKIEGGWLVLNHAKYRAKMGADERREYLRIKQQEHRARVNGQHGVNNGQQESTTVKPRKRRQHNAEADSNAEALESSTPLPTAGPEGSDDHKELVKLWCAAYPEHHSGEKYAFQGGKDGQAIKLLLKTSDKKPAEILKMAVAAWKNPTGFFSKQAASLATFNANFNNIRSELNSLLEEKKKGRSTNGAAARTYTPGEQL